MSAGGFQFKQFFVSHDQCAMKVGTDGVLLGSWCAVQQVSSILDAGTGTGLVSLMLAQRSAAQIVAVEIDEQAAGQALENVQQSPWSDRVSVVCADFLDYTPNQLFDLIVSNPPYFENSLQAPDEKRTKARHTNRLNYQTLLAKATQMLTPGGRICLILPYDKDELMDSLARENALFISRKCYVKPTPQSEIKRLLIEFSNTPCPLELSELVIETARHQYTTDYIGLTKDFYLKM